MPERDSKLQSPEVHGRVSRVEVAIEAHREAMLKLGRDNERLEKEFREGLAAVANENRVGLAAVASELGKKIDSIASSQSVQARTNWSALAGWCSVCIVVIGGIGVAYVRPLEVKDQQHEALIAKNAADARQAVIDSAVLAERIEWVRRECEWKTRNSAGSENRPTLGGGAR